MRRLSLLDDEKEEERKREKTREKKLYEAAMGGSIASLLEFLHEDLSSASDTPLHIAALLGRSDLAKELLGRRPQLAKALNSRGSSPLHVACAKGYVEIVKELLSFIPDVCFMLDSDGISPLHHTAIKGRAKILTELVRVKPEATQVLTGRGETGLHLCVKYNRLEALKVLVESMDREDGIMNWKDDDGNTVLHLAVAKRQIEVIKFLLSSTGIEVNTQNANGITALHALYQSPRDLRDRDIKESLQCAGASRTKNSSSIRSDSNIVEVFPTTQLSKMEKIVPKSLL